VNFAYWSLGAICWKWLFSQALMYGYGEEEPCAYTCFIYLIEFMLKVQIGFCWGVVENWGPCLYVEFCKWWHNCVKNSKRGRGIKVCAPWCTTWRSWYQLALGGIMEGNGNVKL
jgi:hypothetical protein